MPTVELAKCDICGQEFDGVGWDATAEGIRCTAHRTEKAQQDKNDD